MLRSLSKVAGSAAAAVAAVSGPVSAHVDSSAATKRSKSSLSHSSSGPFYMDDEYDFCQEDIAKGGELLSKLGGVPSQEEAEEATRELQTNFIKNSELKSPSSRTLGPNINEGPISEVKSVSMLASNERCYNVQESTSTVVQKGSPSADQMQAVTSQGGNNVVTWCVDLLQHDPNVQAAVVSLARDPAIWKAFVNNEKVQELMQTRDMNPPQLNDDGQASGFNYEQERVNPFLVALHCVQNVVWQVMDTLVDLVNSVFGFVDRKLFGEQDSDPLDKTYKACMVLTILVLALVVIKRGPVVA
ncbi:unnamed protein product [Sphagnum compactum]